MSPRFHTPLLKKRAMDALLDTMAEADYESLGAHRRGEPYEPEQKGTEAQHAFDVTIPAKDISPPSGPGDAAFFKESDPEFEMSASGMIRVFAKGDSPEWQKIHSFLAGHDYRWYGRVSDGTEMWGRRAERVVYDPATMTWKHSVGGVVDLEGTEPELERKIKAYYSDKPTPKSSAVKNCVACETDWCLEHRGIPEVEAKEHEFFKESEPLKTADSETRSYGMDQPIGGSDNATGGSDDENADDDQNAGLGGMDMTSSWKSPLLKKRALVDIHETPTMLPPRKDMQRHLDQDEQDEAMIGVMDGVTPQPRPRRPAKPEQIDPNLVISSKTADDYDEQLDQEGEYFLDQVRDAENEAKRHFMEEDYLQQIADEYIPPISMEKLWKIMGEEYTAEFYGSPYTRAHDFTDEAVPESWEGVRQTNDSKGNAGRFASAKRCPLCKSANTRKVDDDAKGYRSGMVLAECRDCRGFYTTSAH